jgi:REP element-mobilizing transposase RayT
MGLPKRKHLRRLERIFDGTRAPLYYLTCCVHSRIAVLARPDIAEVLETAWREAEQVHGWLVGRFVVMPDHVHFFASPCGEEGKSLSQFMESWKRWTQREIRQRGIVSFRWQKEFFDHLLRSDESYGGKWDYVRENPVRERLVTSPDEWPFQGEVYPLEW